MMLRSLRVRATARAFHKSGILSKTLFPGVSQTQSFSTRRRGGFPATRGRFAEPESRQNAPAPARRVEDAWVSVKDDASGGIYWWNQETNETTAVGEPKPTSAQAIQTNNNTAPQPGGFGQTLKEGFAFGAGAGIAHGVIGSIFGGMFGGGSDDSDSSGDGWV